MAKKTTKKVTRRKTSAKTASPAPRQTEAYEAAIATYSAALEMMRKGEYSEAAKAFRGLATNHSDESELADRARTYANVCERKLTPTDTEPDDAEGRYHRAVFLANAGRLEEAASLLDQALNVDPGNATYLYARASVHALRANADGAVADLRQAVAIEPAVRFQAINDPDFEQVRDDAAFIDVIEPTPAGA
jgi:tetratricopeptide (TPR) repeat protein